MILTSFIFPFTGNLVANGVIIESVDTLDNDVKVYHLSDFLFDHSEIQAITEEYKQLNAPKSITLLSGKTL